MANDFEKKLEQLFLHKEKILDLLELENIIHNSVKLSEATKPSQIAKSITTKIPGKKITGLNDTTTDEQARRNFISSIRFITKNGKTLFEKFNLIRNFIEDDNPQSQKSLSQILNKLTVIRMLQTLIFEYDGSTSGNLHESFVAGLTGGKLSNKSNNIDDIIDFEGGISLKLLSLGSDATGSINNLLTTIINKGGQTSYYIGFKDEKIAHINYYNVIVDKNNLHLLTNIYSVLGIPLSSKGLSADKILSIYNTQKDNNTLKDSQFRMRIGEIKKFESITLDISKKALYTCIYRNKDVLDENISLMAEYYNC